MTRRDSFLSIKSLQSRGVAIRWLPIFCVFALLAIGLYYLDWNGKSAGFLSDDAVYLLMADGFSPFRHAEPELTHYVLRQSLFPPLYPLLLAMLGAGSGALLWAHLITTTTLLFALAIYGCWIFFETRDRFASIALVAVFALLPGTLLLSLELFSEFPYLFLSLLALWLAARASDSGRGYLPIALCVGLAAVTRSAGVSLILAMAIWLFAARAQWRTKALALAVAIAPSVIWSTYKAIFVGSKGGYDQFWIWLAGQFRDNQLSEFVPHFLKTQSNGLWNGLLTNLDMRPSAITQVVLIVMVAAALPIWIRRLRSWRLDAWYFLIGGAMIFLYPFPNFFTRLLLPWIPTLLFYSYLGLHGAFAGRAHVVGKPVLAYGALFALLLTLFPSLGFIAHQLAEPIDPQLANWKHTRYWFRFENMDKIRSDVAFRQDLIQASEEIQQWVPKGECAFAVHTGIAMLYGRRIFEQPPPPSDSPPVFDERSRACQYFFLMAVPGPRSDSEPAFYPVDRLSSDQIETVHVWKDERDPKSPTAVLLRRKPPA